MVDLEGNWWANGMHGTMAELMSSIEERRAPSNSARASLPGLALYFAALQSACSHEPADPRTVLRPPDPAGLPAPPWWPSPARVRPLQVTEGGDG